MNIRGEPPAAYFVHIPKTGGSTLGRLLGQSYLPWQRVRLNPPRMARLKPEGLGRFRFYHAMHQGRPLLELTGRTDLIMLTMLREPVERTVSQILYLQRIARREPHTFTPEYLDAVRPILDADLTAPVDETAFRLACDRQIATLGARLDYRPLFKGGGDVAAGRTLIRPYPLPALMDNDDIGEVLANARDWLTTFHLVGLTEDYGRSLVMARDLLGLPRPWRVPRVNANPARRHGGASDYRHQISPRLRDQIMALTAPDQDLYQQGVELFEQQWARFCRTPRRTYSIGPHLRQILPGHAALSLVKVVLRPVKRVALRVAGTRR